jgi:hypothetical protein
MKRVIALILILCVLGTAGCAEADPDESTIQESIVQADTIEETEPFSLDDYKSEAKKYSEALKENADLLFASVEYEINYWKAQEAFSGIFTSQELVDKSMSWLMGKTGVGREYIEYMHEDVSSMYKNLVLQDVSGKEAEEIDRIVRELFEYYIQLFNLTFSPSENRIKLTEEYESLSASISNSLSKLDVFL